MTPKPSIERTCPGKPGQASHLKQVHLGQSKHIFLSKIFINKEKNGLSIAPLFAKQ